MKGTRISSGRSNRCRGRHRRGAALIAVMVFLTLFLLLFAQMLRSLALEVQQTRTRRHQLQSTWLAQAALDRAAAKLSVDPQYMGENWRVSTEMVGGDVAAGNRTEGTVEIRVEASSEGGDVRQVSVIADYPNREIHRVRTRKSLRCFYRRSRRHVNRRGGPDASITWSNCPWRSITTSWRITGFLQA